jgi:hypothetical protein
VTVHSSAAVHNPRPTTPDAGALRHRARMDEVPDPLVLRRDAVRNGWSDGELARLVRRGEWSRIRRGAYRDGPRPEGPLARHRLAVAATLAAVHRTAVVSHQSAAVLHGFPLWEVALDRVHVTRRPPGWHDRSPTLCVHVARLRDEEVVQLAGVPVTDPVRTALDLARSQPFEVAVVSLDAALRRGLVTRDGLADRAFDIAGTRGSRAAARAIAFADGRSESVGESRSRVLLQRLGLPSPTLQHEITTTGGRFLGRADFAWEEQRVVGEFDGRVKYGRYRRPGEEPGDAVFREKRREDAIRDEGWTVVRWTWSDLADPNGLAGRLRRALDRRPG